MSNNWRYMPILKWKRGEQDALRYLKDEHWEGVTPLVELQPIGAAPDAASLNAALPGYVKKIAEQIIKSVPEGEAIAIDTVYVCTGFPKQANLMLSICKRLSRLIPHEIIPVVRAGWLDALPGLPPQLLEILKASPDVVLRFRTDSFAAAQVSPSVDALAKIVKKRRIHLLLDQFSLVDKLPADCVTAVTPYLVAATGIACASVTLGGGSFPVNLTGKKQGFTDIQRVEWKAWGQITKNQKYPELRYADYAVTNPTPLEEDIDPTKLNPSIAIRYASDGFWRLYKGRGFKSGARGELRALCKLLTSDPIYIDENYCYGDKQYMKKSTGDDKNGVPWTWRRDATNRHLVLTLNSL